MNSLDTDYLFGTVGTVAGTSIALTIDCRLREGQSILENLTIAKVQRAALYAIASIAPIITAFASKEKGAVLLSLVGSALCVFGASRIRDYDDAKELQIMKTLAEGMTFRELKQTHGLDRLVKYQMVQDLPAKFSLAYSNVPFSSILKEHSLAQIAQYQLAPLTMTGFLHDKFIHELSARKWDFLNERNFSNPLYTNILSTEMYIQLSQITTELGHIDKAYQRTLDELNIAYSGRTDVLLAKFAERERNIPVLARKFGDLVASQATGNAFGNAAFNAVWDESTKNIFRDVANGYNVAEAAGKYAERAEFERLHAELKQDRENPILIARGAQEQRSYDLGLREAQQVREASIAQMENTLAEIIARN
ncbi:MAG TPA: hypothetical protein VLE96_03810 [Chlamydiales bacterium]|nr:hypothetical protein [Chlamydiales bacterium]